MRAVLLAGFGDPDLLFAAEVGAPRAAPGQVLVAVTAAAVNFADVLIRRGAYGRAPELPAILGHDVAGTVIEGDPSGTFVPGQRVVAFAAGGGGYADVVAVDCTFVFPAPDALDDAACAALPMAGLTALLAVEDLLAVGVGDTVLVHGAGGGVGSAAVQLARARGARVVATASTSDRLRVAERLGADLVLDRRDGDIADAVMDWTSGAGVDGVVDPLGGEVLSGSLRAVRPRGGVVALGQAAGPWPDVPLVQIVGRNLSVHGLDLGRLARLAPHALRAAGERLCDRASAGALSPVVGARFALEDAGAAHALIERGGHAGKVVLETARG